MEAIRASGQQAMQLAGVDTGCTLKYLFSSLEFPFWTLGRTRYADDRTLIDDKPLVAHRAHEQLIWTWSGVDTAKRSLTERLCCYRLSGCRHWRIGSQKCVVSSCSQRYSQPSVNPNWGKLTFISEKVECAISGKSALMNKAAEEDFTGDHQADWHKYGRTGLW
jgi:hypothetical protein